MTKVKKNQVIEVEVENIAFGGRGLAKLNGYTVFVDQAVPGDRAVIRIALSLIQIKRDIRVIGVDAFAIAKEAGEVRTANVALVGALSVHLDVEADLFESIIEQRVPQRFLKENMKAFAGGRAAGGE